MCNPVARLLCFRSVIECIRAKGILHHLDSVCPAFLFGNRPHCQASQVWTHLAWALEESFINGRAKGGIVADIDIEKAFNHLPREVVHLAAIALGLPQPLFVGWSGALGSLVRRFQIRNHLGPAASSTTGFPEGCALSCVGMMLMDILFHKWFEVSFCQPVSYVDDLHLITTNPSDIPLLMDHLLRFADLVDLKVDQRKTFVWCNCAFQRNTFRQAGLKVKFYAKGHGAQLHFGRKQTTEVLRSRLQELTPLWQKLRNSASPYRVKVMAVKQTAWPRGLHGVTASSVSQASYATLRSQVMRGLGADGAGCNPMVHLGCVEHPTLDPHMWSILETFRVVREAASEEGLGVLIQEALSIDSTIPPFSLTRLLVNRIRHLGWTCTQGVCIRDSLGEFSLFAELAHRVSLAWGLVVSSAVSHRKSFQGLEQSDFHATRAFVKSLDVTDQGLFRKALNGARFTNDMVYHYSETGSLCCEFCGAPDSRYHRFWECPVF